MMPRNAGVAFKRKLLEGRNVAVINVDYSSAALVEFLGGPKFRIDAVMFDAEQGGASIDSIEQMARAARLAGLCSLVRTFSPDPGVIERLMHRGIDGIIVPRLDAAEQFESVVETVRYCYPSGFESKVIVTQIESLAAYQNLDRILMVDGIDAFFIGPVDLSKSMGHRGNYAEPEVMEVIDDICRRAVAAGRKVGILIKPGDVTSWTDRGVSFLYFHVNDWLELGSRRFPFKGG